MRPASWVRVAWAIEEGLKGQQQVLRGYVNALHAELAQDTVRAVAELDRIVELGPGTPLRPRSLIRLSELNEEPGTGWAPCFYSAFHSGARFSLKERGPSRASSVLVTRSRYISARSSAS